MLMIKGLGFIVYGLGGRSYGSEVRFKGLGFQGLGVKVFGFRVQG